MSAIVTLTFSMPAGLIYSLACHKEGVDTIYACYGSAGYFADIRYLLL